MKTILSAAALAAALGLCAAPALAQPSGGPGAKGNAPLKPAHTVNDGAAKHGRNSFTEAQARRHIEKAGFTGVGALTKGDDGVWRGQAMRGGQSLDVAMDFKGNVSTGGGAPAAMAATPAAPAPMAAAAPAAMSTTPSDASASTSTTTTTTTSHGAAKHHRARHHHRRHLRSHCAQPGPNGAACSGVDRNENGISDREDRAIRKGAKP